MPISILVTGGARSGKSRFAQAWGEARPAPRIYVATAGRHDSDPEMQERIARHRAERERLWAETAETPLNPVTALQAAAQAGNQVAMMDCVTLWLNNLGHQHDWNEQVILTAVDGLAAFLAAPPLDIAVVTNEVGDGIVPDNALARRFRDLQGWANQRLAAAAHNVVLVVCGIPLEIKK